MMDVSGQAGSLSEAFEQAAQQDFDCAKKLRTDQGLRDWLKSTGFDPDVMATQSDSMAQDMMDMADFERDSGD